MDDMEEIDDTVEMFLMLHLLYIYKKYKIQKKFSRPRRWGVRPQNKERTQLGHFYKLIQIMKNKDPDQFYKYTRMTIPVFNKLLRLVSPYLEKDSVTALCPAHRLLITL